MNINYSQKYLKYKNKYLNIKNKYQYGGSGADQGLPSIISNQDIDPDLGDFDAPVDLVLPVIPPLSFGVSNGPDNLDDLDDFGEPPRFAPSLSRSIQNCGIIVKNKFTEEFKNIHVAVLNIVKNQHSCRDLLEEVVKNMRDDATDHDIQFVKHSFRERFSPNMGEPLYNRFTQMVNSLFNCNPI
jgi:hypothetical protein